MMIPIVSAVFLTMFVASGFYLLYKETTKQLQRIRVDIAEHEAKLKVQIGEYLSQAETDLSSSLRTHKTRIADLVEDTAVRADKIEKKLDDHSNRLEAHSLHHDDLRSGVAKLTESYTLSKENFINSILQLQKAVGDNAVLCSTLDQKITELRKDIDYFNGDNDPNPNH